MDNGPPAIRSVAIIGAGSMGAHMARHARAAGFDLTICDVDSAVRERFASEGVRATALPDELAGCDVVIILVATPGQLHDVALGEHGLARIDPARMPAYVAVSSTVAADDVEGLAAALPTRLVDAPVSGGVVGAERAELTFLVGGGPDDVAALTPLFQAMGRTVLHCGPLGAGQRTKAINNVIAIANLLISAEAYAIALANGMKLEQLIPALEAGSGRNFLSRAAGDPPVIYEAWSDQASVFDNVRAINIKDIELALEMVPPDTDLPAIRSLLRLLGDCGAQTRSLWQSIAVTAKTAE